MTIQPFTVVSPAPSVAALPKADIHVHQEGLPRLDRLAALRRHRPAYDWRAWCTMLMSKTAPGMERLAGIFEPDTTLDMDGLSDLGAEVFITRIAALLEEEALDGAVLVEVRFGAKDVLLRPDFMALFREAERRVVAQHPGFIAEAIGWLNPVNDADWLVLEEGRFEACLQAARDGLAGVDFRVDPYSTEADPDLWALAYRWAERAADAGLGITVHVGEFSAANILASLRMPGLMRLGHAVYAATDPLLLEAVAQSRATVETSLTCNVVLGAAASYEAHPIRTFVEAGIPVTLNTDLPVHVGTTIAREYAVAAELGFSTDELMEFTRNAVRASFASIERRNALLAGLSRSEGPRLSLP